MLFILFHYDFFYFHEMKWNETDSFAWSHSSHVPHILALQNPGMCLMIVFLLPGSHLIYFQQQAFLFKKPLWQCYFLQSSQSLVPTRLQPSSQPHDQNLLPLATTELNLNLEHSQRKTISNHMGHRTGLIISTLIIRDVITHKPACHVTMKFKSADVLCEVAE